MHPVFLLRAVCSSQVGAMGEVQFYESRSRSVTCLRAYITHSATGKQAVLAESVEDIYYTCPNRTREASRVRENTLHILPRLYKQAWTAHR